MHRKVSNINTNQKQQSSEFLNHIIYKLFFQIDSLKLVQYHIYILMQENPKPQTAFYKVNHVYRACIQDIHHLRNKALCGLLFHLLIMGLEIGIICAVVVSPFAIKLETLIPLIVCVTLKTIFCLAYTFRISPPLFQDSSKRLIYYLQLAKQVECAVAEQPLNDEDLIFCDFNDFDSFTTEVQSPSTAHISQKVIVLKQRITSFYLQRNSTIICIQNVVGFNNLTLLIFVISTELIFSVGQLNCIVIACCLVAIAMEIISTPQFPIAIIWALACLMSSICCPLYVVYFFMCYRKLGYKCAHCGAWMARDDESTTQCQWGHRYHSECSTKVNSGDRCRLCFCPVANQQIDRSIAIESKSNQNILI